MRELFVCHASSGEKSRNSFNNQVAEQAFVQTSDKKAPWLSDGVWPSCVHKDLPFIRTRVSGVIPPDDAWDLVGGARQRDQTSDTLVIDSLRLTRIACPLPSWPWLGRQHYYTPYLSISLLSIHFHFTTWIAMKFTVVLPLAALTAAFVLPDEQVLGNIAIEDHHEHTSVSGWLEAAESTTSDALSSLREHVEELTESSKKAWGKVSCHAKSLLDDAFDKASDSADIFGDRMSEAAADVESWLEDNEDIDVFGGHHGGRHGRRPRKPPHHHKPNQTVFELIAGSKYTTKLAKLVSEYPDLVEALNSTKANYTVFAPTDKVSCTAHFCQRPSANTSQAFEKIPEKAPKPSKEQLKAILSYHVLPGFYPAGRVLSSHTAPTLLKGEHLSSEPEPQRVAFKITLRGLTVNFYSRIIAINIFGTNGVIHGVDSLLLPPPK